MWIINIEAPADNKSAGLCDGGEPYKSQDSSPLSRSAAI